MRKKILSLVMALALVLTLLPAVSSPAAAAKNNPYTIGTVSLLDADGNIFTSAQGVGWTWTYTSGAGTLTLDNACIKGADNSYGAYLPAGTKILLKGDSTIAGGSSTKSISCGVCAEYDLTIALAEGTDTGSLTAVGGSAGDSSMGLYSPMNKLTVESGKVTGIGGAAKNSSYGIATFSLAVSGTADVTGIAGTANGSAEYTDCCGVSLDAGTVSGGSLTAVGGYAGGSASSYGVFAAEIFNVSGGVVTAYGGKSASGDSYGVFNKNSTSTVSDTGLLVAGSDACVDGKMSHALSAAPTLTASNLLTGAADSDYAVYGPSGTYAVIDATHTVTVGNNSLAYLDYTDTDKPKDVSGHYTWNTTDNTLTLTNVIINANVCYGLNFPKDATLVLDGVNIVHCSCGGDHCAVTGAGALTVEGGGTLIAMSGAAANSSYAVETIKVTSNNYL